MKKLFATTALVLIASSGAVSAQSVLERVLTDLDGTNEEVTGIFANTADNVLAGATPDVTNIGGTQREEARTLQVGDVVTIEVDDGNNNTETVRVQVTDSNGDGTPEYVALAESSSATYAAGDDVTANIEASNVGLGGQLFVDPATGALAAYEGSDFTEATRTVTVDGDSFSTSGINASITNVLRGLDDASADTGVVTATDAVDALIGNISTTGLGAVNTGDIALSGANASFSENVDTAVAGTTEAVKEVVDHTVTQVGTTSGQTMVALNSALNETNVNASVTNVMSGVNATIGRSGFEDSLTDTTFENVAGMDADAIAALTGGISTTGLGAVNTGTIVSGAQQDVTGVVTSIVGNAATSQ